jgi:predicted AlkP superfamily phosphohydrolase/phosphomutase
MGESARRVLVIGLDGFEATLAEAMAAEGLLPNWRALAAQSARFKLDHGWAKYTGLAWEHFSAGKSPDDLRNWSAVRFDPATYSVRQDPTTARPFLADCATHAVVFDIPYFDLAQAPNVRGLTSWGAHDPGVAPRSHPASLLEEMTQQFGPYPAPQWIYGFTWPSAEKTQALGRDLRRAVDVRSAAARWLLGKRLPDWDLAVVVVSEAHSVIEPLWHGHDAAHPLHAHPSAPAAREGLRGVYTAIDDMLGKLRADFADATIVLFAMHGMGANEADLPAMFLIPELMYRHAFGRPYASTPRVSNGMLSEDEVWDRYMYKAVPWPGGRIGALRKLLRRRDARPGRAQAGNLAWMPAARYATFWPQMKAFALPAYYDGQIRINLAGREAAGIVLRHDYEAVRAEVSRMLRTCRNPLTGEEVIAEIVLPEKAPEALSPTEADLYLTFRPNVTSISHEHLGTIGPVPYRRTGGHTGAWGFLHVSGPTVAPGERGTASSFDVVPTLLDLVAARGAFGLSGQSLIERLLGPGEIERFPLAASHRSFDEAR